ncbi:hypothetical protein THOM_2151 [Trachipleistophora hominis]|uniref:Uncharacterized protein n=1 Tax=Trachipleistophora hominis TaxID=72359 RepID=L7JUC1_TRAHO|nr:hypothetical protein THOM_2151 [Trachipleistophora hominis]
MFRCLKAKIYKSFGKKWVHIDDSYDANTLIFLLWAYYTDG